MIGLRQQSHFSQLKAHDEHLPFKVSPIERRHRPVSRFQSGAVSKFAAWKLGGPPYVQSIANPRSP